LTDPPYDFESAVKDEFHKQFMRISKTGAIVFSPPENQWQPTCEQYLFWEKPISTKNTSRRYSRFVEMIQVFGKGKWNAGRHWSQYTNVFRDLVEGETDHPFEKPTSLLSRLIKNHSDEGDLIFDPFMGSGTTGVCCARFNRSFIGIEKNKEYFAIATKRFGQKVLHEKI